jgi:hypothetical protein
MNNFMLWNVRFDEPANWLIAHTLVNPADSGQPYNFGWDSYFPRAYIGAPWDSDTKTYTSGGKWYANVSMSLIAAESANTQSGFVIFPFSFGGKAWTSLGVVAATSVPLKIASLAIALVMIKKLAYAHTVLVTSGPGGCAKVGGCPILDGGFSDNLPLTQILSQASYKNVNKMGMLVAGADKPTLFMVVGPSSTMKVVGYLLGQGPLGIWTFSGVNICPVPDPGWCTALTMLREWVVERMPNTMYDSWMAIGDAYQVYRPSMQVIAPFCGDPLAIDEFAGSCTVQSVCYMYSLVLPSKVNRIKETSEDWIIALTLLYLGNTDISARFVGDFVPSVITDGSTYYGTMATWFPNFSLFLPAKGGMGFTSLSGNSLMDYLTYIVIRLSFKLMMIREYALILQTTKPLCEYSFYKSVAELNVGTTKWEKNQLYSPPVYMSEVER